MVASVKENPAKAPEPDSATSLAIGTRRRLARGTVFGLTYAGIALIVGLSVAYARVSAEVAARGEALAEKDRALGEKTKAQDDASREAR